MLTLLKRASDFGFRLAYDPLQNKRAVPRCTVSARTLRSPFTGRLSPVGP